jgi:hypothetical protein
VAEEGAIAGLLPAAEAGGRNGTPARPDRTALADRLAEVRNWACLLAVVPPSDLETFDLVVAGPDYAASASGQQVVEALRAERCLVVAILPLGPLLRQLGAAERARARWTRWRRAPWDGVASMVERRAEVARRVRRLIDSGFDGVYLDDLDLPLGHGGRDLDELIRAARHALPDHLLLAQAVEWLPGDVAFDALGPSSTLAVSSGEDETIEWTAMRAVPEAGQTVGDLASARSSRDLIGPWRRLVDRQLLERRFDAGRDQEGRA